MLLAVERPYGEVARGEAVRDAVHRLQSVFKFEESSEGKLERMLIGVVDGTNRKIQTRRAGLLNVIAEDVGDWLAFEESDETLGAGLVGWKIRDIEPTGIEVVAGEHDAGLRVVEGDGVFVVAWDRNDVQDAAAKVDLSHARRPGRNRECL